MGGPGRGLKRTVTGLMLSWLVALWLAPALAAPLSWPGESATAHLEFPAAQRERPETWGVLHFMPELLSDGSELIYETREAVVPAGEAQVYLDGILRPDEWRDALTLVHRYRAGSHLAVLVKHVAGQLYLGLAVPAQQRVRADTVVEIGWDAPRQGTQPLGESHHLLRLTVVRDGRTQVQYQTGKQGFWTTTTATGGIRGRISGSGDGVWPYLAVECVLPLENLGSVEGLPAPMGFFVRVEPASRGKLLAATPGPVRETIRWPDGRAFHSSRSVTGLGERPDFWRRLTWSGEAERTAEVIPWLSTPVQLDGLLGSDEWLEAAQEWLLLPGGQWRTICYGRDARKLYVGVRWSLARGIRQAEECHLWLDPQGDGGLRPRADDILLMLTAKQAQMVQAWTYHKGAWQGKSQVAALGITSAPDAFERHCEFAIPLPAATETLGLAAEVSWARAGP